MERKYTDWVLHKRQEVNQKLYKPLYISDQYVIKFHILLRVGKPRNIEHMLTQFYKTDLHQNVDIRKKCKELRGKKKANNLAETWRLFKTPY